MTLDGLFVPHLHGFFNHTQWAIYVRFYNPLFFWVETL